MEKKRNAFMRKIQERVWTELNDRGIDFTFGEINAHFTELMKDEKIIEVFYEFFLNRFLEVKSHG